MELINKPRIFIGSASESLGIARMLERRLQFKAEIVIWDAMMVVIGEHTIDALINLVDTIDFAIMVFSNDDKVSSRGIHFEAPRDNVIFELGLFMSKLGKNRTFIVNNISGLKIPSDLAGITYGIFNSERQDHNLAAAVSPVCTEIEYVIERYGIRRDKPALSTQNLNSIKLESDISISQHDIFRKIGIHQLDYSILNGYSVKDCIDNVKNNLCFLGVGGKKWIQEKKSFDDLIRRLLLRRQKDQIRFLLLNPECDDAINFNEGRDFSHQNFVDDLNKTIDFFANAKKKSGIDIQLRLYSRMPNFRITIIDQTMVVLGTYSTLSLDGLDGPQLILRNSSEWSFTQNLTAYFESLWNESIIQI